MNKEKYKENFFPVNLLDRSVRKRQKWLAIRRILTPGKRKLCLDIGCGSGGITYRLREQGGSWVSADLSYEPVHQAKKDIGGMFVVTDTLKMGLYPGSFQRIVALDLIEYITNYEAFFKEISLLLAPNGEFYLCTPNADKKLFWNRIRNRLGITDEIHGRPHPLISIDELYYELKHSNLTISETINFCGFFSEMMQAFIDVMYLFLRKFRRRNSIKIEKPILCVGDVYPKGLAYKLYSLFYPVIWAISSIDRLRKNSPGYSIMLRAVKVGQL